MGVTENGRLCCPFQFFPPVDQLMCWVARFWRRNPNPMRNTKSSTTVACGCRRSPPPVPCGTGVWATTAKTITSPLNALAKIKSETRWHKKQRESFCTANSRPTINHICAKYKKKRKASNVWGASHFYSGAILFGAFSSPDVRALSDPIWWPLRNNQFYFLLLFFFFFFFSYFFFFFLLPRPHDIGSWESFSADFWCIILVDDDGDARIVWTLCGRRDSRWPSSVTPSIYIQEEDQAGQPSYI